MIVAQPAGGRLGQLVEAGEGVLRRGQLSGNASHRPLGQPPIPAHVLPLRGPDPARTADGGRKELTEARERIHREYAAAVWAVRAAPRGDAADTYQAGVKAALDVVRRLSFPYADTGADDDGGTGADG